MEVHDARGDLGLDANGNDEGLTVAIVKALGEHARQFEVLSLVVADRDFGRFVEQDIPGHQDRVGEQADAITRLARGLLLELGHATEFAIGGDALEEPIHLRVVRHFALQENRADLGVQSGR